MFKGFRQRRLRGGRRFQVSASPNSIVSVRALFCRVWTAVSPMSIVGSRWFQDPESGPPGDARLHRGVVARSRMRKRSLELKTTSLVTKFTTGVKSALLVFWGILGRLGGLNRDGPARHGARSTPHGPSSA